MTVEVVDGAVHQFLVAGILGSFEPARQPLIGGLAARCRITVTVIGLKPAQFVPGAYQPVDTLSFIQRLART